MFVEATDDYRPLTWIGKCPIHLTTLLVIIHVAAMIGCALVQAFGGGAVLQSLAFSSQDALRHGAVWQFVTYPFLNSPTIWFAIEMVLLFAFGREVERFIGRTRFLWLYVTLLLVAPVALTLIGFFAPSQLSGSGALHLGIFFAFATVYPNVEFFARLGVLAKWVAFALLGIYSLRDLSSHDWPALVVLWTSASAAFFYICSCGVDRAGWLTGLWEHETPAEPQRAPSRPPRPPREPDAFEAIDPLLDKISKHGINSLTPRERGILEAERKRLLAAEARKR